MSDQQTDPEQRRANAVARIVAAARPLSQEEKEQLAALLPRPSTTERQEGDAA